jgi:hypothetical protein
LVMMRSGKPCSSPYWRPQSSHPVIFETPWVRGRRKRQLKGRVENARTT